MVFAGVFVLALPTFNLLFIGLVLFQLGVLEINVLGGIALRMYLTFGLAYVLILLSQRLFPLALSEEKLWPQLFLHIASIFITGQFFGPMLSGTPVEQFPQPTVFSLVYTLFQITLYVVVKTLILQRDHYLATQINLRQVELNMLRSQSNPHFLFNTLNLLASEIKRNPATAQDIVYDLADLLRESMRAAEREFIHLDEELRLAALYLAIQEKRFPERLCFQLDIEERCERLMVPSLLLQPVIENVIKHVVSHSNGKTSLNVWARIKNGSLSIGVEDNGPHIDSGTIKQGKGLRILRDTLALHYGKKANVIFESTREGGRVTISLPCQSSLAGS
ncbi:MAG: hypothetical protein Hals2KO_25450 [Halioglobus sp.]